MDATPDTTIGSPRSPALAVILGALFPGLGHQYVGEPRIALRVMLCIGIGWPLVLATAVAIDRDPLLTVGFSVAIGISAQIGLAVDAYRRAKRHVEAYALRPCNRTIAYLTYVGLFLVFVVLPSELRTRYVVETFTTPTNSFAPTLEPRDHFIVTKLVSRDRNPQRGDIVVFEYPDDPREKFVKRLIGLPGETVVIHRDGRVEIDGVPLQREEIAAPTHKHDGDKARYFLERTPEGVGYVVRMSVLPNDVKDGSRPPRVFEVPQGTMFVLGDNRRESHDSSEFGPVRLDALVGRARAVWWPTARMGELR